ncbi:hypothetical protein [Sphingomonas sp.]|uniref:hypothetical protein n=1 Tax=Sphingomonas sp. TaxID=28214 RepID=UPI00286A29D7|nr:hypothetical protein [Sphingomonas sp.]
MRHPDFPTILPVGFLPSTTGEPEVIDFTPVPRKRRRHDGWTEARQRVFIQSLAACGSVSAAARHVGKTARSAYRLLDSEGATSFSLAWDKAIEEGIERTRSDALIRALFGALVPIYRRGKLQRVELRKSDRLALGLLGGNRQTGSSFGSMSAEDRAAIKADFRRYDAAAPGFARELVVREVVAEISATCARRRAKEELEAQAIAAYERAQWDDRETSNG